MYTPEYLTEDEIRQHCRIDAADDTQEAVISIYVRAACDYVITQTGRTEAEIYDVFGEMPAPLVSAMLLVLGDNFAYREAGRPANIERVPRAVAYLIAPYARRGVV